ncbi:MAG: hypothetical protein OEO20_00595 [Gemmatimonadota bacterium]|nr:hypothetical protein [Gemmatimonadota bacterium]MDH3366254.1 hypothetical protein [Gemmatimonadota bacterium]MDH3476787.1 hypothetical protein [Gemmatimonadota bacterium]MDH3570819.1 hypothetical protein [Gemmatimonadota bacterium]MDH5550130.1 hypothetical protein [Gemmatimonadota bacterium]
MPTRSETKLVLNGGLFAGLLGYGTVVVLFALINVLAGQSPFYTPAMFGGVLFYGLSDPSALEITPGPVLAYNMVHVLAFLALGFVASWLVAKAERYPVFRYAVLFVLIFVGAHIYAALLLFGQSLLTGGAWWQIGVVSLAAAVVMGWYLLRLHPALREGLTTLPLGDEE